ncbi:glucose-6-phosphate 1-dehydrogenase-like protein [Thamnocephalis sphaerospora]|uniref:Glucose-6-phosphate 1-dehydrogenase n=1 Tax=Thamnocephalis sphaerospora TaxID=78915 RepID=A0A4P9XVQ1_9FUNG|nr:glucose-6-phosphate 1-dehydrogenase-like protein [Thamnocephalis sphaerospora]|eukprot:RKP10348.1 glucose-6-phosphate 1-dehydrogenase-like protein [Thamnocephalis sphaerospora]
MTSQSAGPQKKHERKRSLLDSDKPQKITVIVFGASGDLAKKKTYPALFGLYRNGFLPAGTQIVGYARTKMELDEFHKRITGFVKLPKDEQEAAHIQKQLDEFKRICHYQSGQYDQGADFDELNQRVRKLEMGIANANRVFYLALPPSQFINVAAQIRKHCYAEDGENRIIVEKPFGKDLDSSRELQAGLSALFREDEVYRIDHYLGKEMVKNLLILRFANVFFGAIWSRQYIENVQITFKEAIGTQGRGGYFDEFGIIRDVMQNHLLQILSIIGMERPVTLDSEDVRDEKVKLLRAIRPLETDDVVLGQYTASADGKEEGYLDDKTVPKGSKTPTYAAAAFWINNERWEGVPFILKCGKALNEQKTEIRIQFRDVPGSIFPGELARNELVVRVQPNEAVYMKMMNKMPGLSFDTTISELDLSYDQRYSDHKIPDAYESLILDCLRGDHSNFVRNDELDAAWKIFTPLLHKIDAGEVDSQDYEYGSRGPERAIEFVRNLGYIRHHQQYVWNDQKGKL